MTADEIAACFTGADGAYHFARWSRPVAPVVFGTDETSLGTIKGALEAVLRLARHPMVETDPELGANLMIFFLRDWDELTALPDLDALVPGIGAQAGRLQAEGADQYRHVRFEADGAIRAVFAFLRMAGPLADMPAEDLALNLAVQVLLLWSGRAFGSGSALARSGGATVLRPEVADLIRVAYDPVLPVAARDPSHALRLAARIAARGR